MFDLGKPQSCLWRTAHLSVIYRTEERERLALSRRTKNITGKFLASARLTVSWPSNPLIPTTIHGPDQRFARCPELKSALKQWHQKAGGDPPSESEGVGNRDGAQAVCEVDGWDNWTRRRQGHPVALLSKPTAAVSDAAPDQAVIGGRQPFPAALRCAVGSVSQAPEFRSERRADGWLVESGWML